MVRYLVLVETRPGRQEFWSLEDSHFEGYSVARTLHRESGKPTFLAVMDGEDLLVVKRWG